MLKRKKILTLLRFANAILIMFCFSFYLAAQSPEKFSYQAIIRNATNNIVASQAIGMRISILQGSAAGAAVFIETHAASTDANGLVTVEVGAGTPVLGTLAAITWSAGPYFLKTEIDPLGGTTYNMTGTSQFLSVPYALYAKTADYNNLSNKPVLDGSETKITAGPDATVTGTGTTLTPYQAEIKTRSVTEAQKNAIVTPFAGQVVWCNECGPSGEMQVFNGTIWTSVASPSGPPPEIGDSYQGGIVAYIYQPGDPGYIIGETHGLIAAPTNTGNFVAWGCIGTPIATQLVLGSGLQNSLNTDAGCTTAGIAAEICLDLVLNGYSDWFLPSKDELHKLYLKRVEIGGFDTFQYWSSSHFSNSNAWYQLFNTGGQANGSKSGTIRVRAIRYF